MEDMWIVPKNIRQIGESHNHISIFIEDYAATFISQFARNMGEEIRQAICLGRIYEETERTSLIVEGIVMDERTYRTSDRFFAPEDVEKLRQECDVFFPQKKVIGRLIMDTDSRRLPESAMWTLLTERNGFAIPGTCLLMQVGREEGIHTFYVASHGARERLENYYIYYDKNEEMQNYLITWHEKLRAAGQEETSEAEKGRRIKMQQGSMGEVSERIQQNWTGEGKERRSQAESGKGIGSDMNIEFGRSGRRELRSDDKRPKYRFPLAECAACLILIAACVTGIINLNNYQKMRDFEETLNQLSIDFYGDGNYAADEGVGDGNTDNHLAGGTSNEDSYVDLGVNLPIYHGEADTAENDQENSDGTDDISITDNSGNDTNRDASGIAAGNEEAEDGPGDTENEPNDGESQQTDSDSQRADSGGQQADSGSQPEITSGDVSGDGVQGSAGEEIAQTQTDVYREYIVEQGDTLSGICYTFYQDLSRVAEICSINGITNPDRLMVGQKILLP